MKAYPEDEQIIISFIVVVRNEAKELPELLDDFLAQDFPFRQLELLLVDGESTDGTLDLLNRFARENPRINAKILHNPARILSSGWNIALSQARGKILLRVDAHSRIPSDFVSKNVRRILAGEAICGGYLETLRPDGFWPRLLYHADTSRFSGGNAPFRNPGKARYVDTIAYAAYRRDVFAKVGGFDERLIRNQDNEMHYRMRKAGYQFCYDPEIHAYYICRKSLISLLQQKYGNGYWMGLALGISPFCFRLRHWTPFFFLTGLMTCLAFALAFPVLSWRYSPLAILLLMYFSTSSYFTFEVFRKESSWKKVGIFLLPVIFFLLHSAYGWGTLIGLLSLPFSLWKNRIYEVKMPIND